MLKEKDDFFIGMFCSPTKRVGNYPNRINQKVINNIKNIGIKAIYDCGDDGDSNFIEMFSLCDKFGLDFYPHNSVYDQYLFLESNKQKGIVSYLEMSDKSKADLDLKFKKQIEQYKNYKSFAGIFFGDEKSYFSFASIGRAKRIFENLYPDKNFIFNNLSYALDEYLFWGIKDKTKYNKLPLNCEFLSKNRFNFYDEFINKYIYECNPKIYSCDLYPFCLLWDEIPTSIHRGLFELNAYYSLKKKTTNGIYHSYIQTGMWGECNRELRFGEMALQINVVLAYGNEGIIFFPGCYPKLWLTEFDSGLSKNGRTGLIDIYGNTSIYGEYSKKIIKDIKIIWEYLKKTEFIGIYSYGEFNNGYNKNVDLLSLKDGDCIYNGKLPAFNLHKEENIVVKSSSQITISTFINSINKIYFVMNTSTLFKVDFQIIIKKNSFKTIYRSQIKLWENIENISFQISPGESMIIIFNN